MVEILTPKNLAVKMLICLTVLAAIMVSCAFIGSQNISLRNVLAGPGSSPGDNIDYQSFVGVRLPRIILAALVGAALACTGVVLQAILRNPLADPYILGISKR